MGSEKTPDYKQKSKTKKFILNFGYRRHTAVGKLGYKTIPAHILSDTDDTAEYEVINLIENLHRSSITDYEKGRMYSDMINKYDLTTSELAARLGVKMGSVTTCIKLVKLVPKKYANKIADGNEAKSHLKNGKISSSMAKRIIGNEVKHNLNPMQREKMFDYGRQDGVSAQNIDTAFRMMSSGSTITNAITKASKIKVLTIDVPITHAAFSKLVREYGDISSVKKAFTESLYGEGDLVVSKP